METSRLRLQPLTPENLDAIHRIWTEPGVRKHLWDGKEIPRERAEKVLVRNARSFEESGYGVWGIFDKDGDELIGFCGFRAFEGEVELIYGLATPHWGKGIATEAAGAGIRFGFEKVGFERITASADTENAASLRVMEKAGMKFEKRLLRGDQDLTYCAISRDDFLSEEDPI